MNAICPRPATGDDAGTDGAATEAADVDVGGADGGGDVGVAPTEAAGVVGLDVPAEQATAISTIRTPKVRRGEWPMSVALGTPIRGPMGTLASYPVVYEPCAGRSGGRRIGSDI